MHSKLAMWWGVALLASVLALAGCGGGSGAAADALGAPTGDAAQPAVAAPAPAAATAPETAAAPVPDGAGASVDSFMAYLRGLSANDETSEPASMQRFAPPAADETAEAVSGG